MTRLIRFRILSCLTTILLASACDTAEPEALEPTEALEFRDFEWTALSLVAKVGAFANAEIQLASSHAFTFNCFEGMAVKSQYSLSYPICLPPLPGYCNDVYEVIQECIDGEFQTTSETLVSHECDYSYNGSSCGWEP